MAEKTKKSPEDLKRDLEALARPSTAPAPTGAPALRTMFIRVGAALAVIWVIAIIIQGWIPKAVAGTLTLIAIGAGIWVVRYVKKTTAIGTLLQGASTEEGRQEALKKLAADFKEGDVQAVMARAQLEMQDNPRKALTTLETIALEKVMGPVADQVRALRGMLHLNLNEPAEARNLVDKMELGKQTDVRARVMFASVASEAWARTGNGKKALETLDLFNADDPEYAEFRPQLWRARAFGYASTTDQRGLKRALTKLAEINPLLLGMFAQGKHIHPLLQQEAKQMMMKLGAVQRQVVRQRA